VVGSWLQPTGRNDLSVNNFLRIAGAFALALPCLAAPAARAQLSPSGTQVRTGSSSLIVTIQSPDGRPIQIPARVTLSAEAGSPTVLETVSNNAMARFDHLAGGRYDLVVSIPGFAEGDGDVEVMDLGIVDTSITMEMAQDPDHSVGAMGLLLAPAAKKELDLGFAAMHANKLDESRQHLQAAFKLAPGDARVNDALGELFLLEKDFANSKDYLERATSLDPLNVTALVDLGDLRIQQKDFAGAQPPLQKAISLAPQDAAAHWCLGVSYLDLKQYEKAMAEANAALSSKKGSETEAEFLLGAALSGLGRDKEAIVALQSFIRQMPNDAYAPAAQTLLAKLQAAPSPGSSATQPAPTAP